MMRIETSFISFCSVLLIAFLISCNSSSPDLDYQSFSDIPVADIRLISEFDQSGDYFFQHLSYNTLSLSGGDVILADREGEFVIKVNRDGEFQELIARDGNGPGEVQDPMFLSLANDSSIVMYDQMRQTSIRKSLVSSGVYEFNPPRIKSFRVNSVYPADDKNIVHMNMKDFSFMTLLDKKLESMFVLYNVESGEILKQFDYPSETYASFIRDGRPAGGATLVPFTPKFLYDYSQDRTEFYTYWTENTHINVLHSISLDTIRTIPVNIPSERLKPQERDSLQENYREEYWPFVQDLLPQIKAPVEKMIIDPQNRIWLKLTLHSDHQQWIVLDQNGRALMKAEFPKKGMVTHISAEHIGFRTDDHLFALYELLE